MQKRILCYAVACLLSLNVFSQYIYEGNQSLVDLTNESDTTNLNSGDDQLSSAFNLDFTFDFYGESFTSARMATNGCLHFGLGTGNVDYNNYCGDIHLTHFHNTTTHSFHSGLTSLEITTLKC